MILIDTDLPKALIHSTNKIFAGVHYRKRAKIKNDYLWWFKSLKIDTGALTLDINNGVYFRYTFIFGKSKRCFDCDNCSFMGKLITDCIVKNGIIKDDSPKYIRKVSYESKKGKDSRVLLEVF